MSRKNRTRYHESNMATAVEEKPKEAKVETPLTGKQLLGYMTDTGTGPGRIKAMETMLRAEPKWTAAQLYQAMHRQQDTFNLATLRKACKYVFGPEAEPESLTKTDPEDEILRLRRENETMRMAVNNADAKNAMLTKQLELERGKSSEMARQVSTFNMIHGGQQKTQPLDFQPTDKGTR